MSLNNDKIINKNYLIAKNRNVVRRLRIITLLIIHCSLFIVLSSCLGLSMDIAMKRDGSGRITMECQIPAALENLGRLDGNQNWPIIPIGKADWERSVSRINGLKLASFSSREKNDEYITNVTLDFDNMDALSAFLKAHVNGNEINLILNKGKGQNINSELLDLLRQASKGKKVSISFSADGKTPNMVLTDKDGAVYSEHSLSSVNIVPSGKKVSFSIETAEIFEQPQGLGIKLYW